MPRLAGRNTRKGSGSELSPGNRKIEGWGGGRSRGGYSLELVYRQRVLTDIFHLPHSERDVLLGKSRPKLGIISRRTHYCVRDPFQVRVGGPDGLNGTGHVPRHGAIA